MDKDFAQDMLLITGIALVSLVAWFLVANPGIPEEERGVLPRYIKSQFQNQEIRQADR